MQPTIQAPRSAGARSDDAPDAVVIGAGHNGLVAANLLADHGWDVVVCEATPHLGGAVRSAEVTSPGYLSDLFSAFYPLSAASPVLRALELDRYGLHWAHSPSVLAHVFPDDRCAVLSRDVDQTAASVEEFAAGDGAAWRAMAQQWEAIRQPLIDALFTPLPALGPARRLLAGLGAAGALRMARLAVLPVRRFGEEQFSGEGAPILLAGNALHADLPPEGAGSALYGWLLAMLGQSYGFPVPVGGAGKLTESLAARLADRGGSVRLSSPVESIEVRDGVAVAVRLATGERIRARRAVLADVTAPALYRDLVGEQHLPARFVADLDNFQWDSPTVKIDWALRSPVPWTAAGARGAGTVHLGVDLDGLTRYAADLATRQTPRQPFLLFGQMTTADPSRSPAGTESAWCYTHLPAGVDFGEEVIAEHVERVEARIERHAPGFAELVVGRYVQSPGRLEQANPSLVHGAVNGGTAQLHQQLVFRPVPGMGGASTPVDRLFLGGSSAHPGGGVHGGPGANAARAALAREGLLGGGRRKASQLLMNRLYRGVGDERPALTGRS
ncbi:MAG TPA: NAD(P)/FAD-dependent oxidoreductase [Jatrophihabitans sp.]|jgi:phytoene dehydrogenase-like protein|uniref:phytoene desaturase family protein n=1 Tax=Jatrophihabitans sp. TaxID=1932789 RepID=UPI002EFCD781